MVPIIGAKGNPLFTDLTSFKAGFEAPRAEHSVKPEEFYDVVRRVTAEPLDMFAVDLLKDSIYGAMRCNHGNV